MCRKMRAFYQRKMQAFAFAGLLFFIAIVGIVASISIVVLKQRGYQQKIERTALQLQQLSQAGIVYYLDNNCWPDNSLSPPKCKDAGNSKHVTGDILLGIDINSLGKKLKEKTGKKSEDFTGYIPVGVDINPWGRKNKYKADEKTGDFLISTEAPSLNVAKEIAALLPRASYNSDNNVFTLVSVPSAGGYPTVNAVWVGQISFDTTKRAVLLQKPTCPTTTPNLKIYFDVLNSNVYDFYAKTAQCSYPSSSTSGQCYLPLFANKIAVQWSLKGANLIYVQLVDNGFGCRLHLYWQKSINDNADVVCDGGGNTLFDNLTVGYTMYCTR